MDLTALIPIILIFAALGLFLALCSEQSQIVAVVLGGRKGTIAAGYNTAMKIMLFNRAGTIIYMLLLSFAIDVGVSNTMVIAVALLSALLVLCFNITLLLRRHKVFGVGAEERQNESILFFLREGGWHYSSASMFATSMHVLGLTLPLLLSNSIPEYRLTMAQTGFLLNAIFTFINVLFIEQRVAKILDHGTRHDAYVFANKVFISRSIAVFIVCLIFTALLLSGV